MNLKLKLSIVLVVASAGFLLLAFQLDSPIWQSFLTGLSSSLLVAALGILAINLYLESTSRKGAVRALFILSQRAIAQFHNLLLDLAWARFGKSNFGAIQQEFIHAGLEPSALKKEQRDQIYEIYATSIELRQHVIALESSLAELSRMIGWSLDGEVLMACVQARAAIAELQSIPIDGATESIDRITDKLLTVDMLSQVARGQLMRIAGIQESG